jgi:hypothetical protein
LRRVGSNKKLFQTVKKKKNITQYKLGGIKEKREGERDIRPISITIYCLYATTAFFCLGRREKEKKTETS